MKKRIQQVKRIVNSCSPVTFAPFGLIILAVVAAILGEWDMAICCTTFGIVIFALILALAYLNARSEEENECFEEMFRRIAEKEEREERGENQ